MSSAGKPMVRKKKRWGKVVEFTPVERDLHASEETRKKIIKEALKARAITPQELADKYQIRVSTAKNILAELANEGKLTILASSRRVKVYSATSS